MCLSLIGRPESCPNLSDMTPRPGPTNADDHLWCPATLVNPIQLRTKVNPREGEDLEPMRKLDEYHEEVRLHCMNQMELTEMMLYA